MRQSIMSFFREPITNTAPCSTVSVESIYQFIRSDEWMRSQTEALLHAADPKSAKGRLLPFVTPGGVFNRRGADALIVASGELVLDVDNLASPEEAERVRQQLFDDATLAPDLVFISPRRHGVKAFIPYRQLPGMSVADCYRQAAIAAMDYFNATYAAQGWQADPSGKDIARCCYLCHDAGAMMR